MKKVLTFSLLLILGLAASQMLPGLLGEGYAAFRNISTTLLYVCLSFIMINVGREFEIDKTRWRSYAADYFIAMATAAVPWLLIALYYVFVLLPCRINRSRISLSPSNCISGAVAGVKVVMSW